MYVLGALFFKTAYNSTSRHIGLSLWYLNVFMTDFLAEISVYS